MALQLTFESILMVLFFVFMITQIIIPLWKDRHLFPLFKKTPLTELEMNLQTLKEIEEEIKLNNELQERVTHLTNKEEL
jgi:hypothetical protein